MVDTFAARWARKERECGFESIASTMVMRGPNVLPNDAAPCLSFKEFSRPVPIWDVFALPADWTPEDRTRLASYLMIGSDGAGNPICVDEATGRVVLLDHEDWFRTYQFVNSSVGQLGECLLEFMGEQRPERFRSAVSGIDSAALSVGAFWYQESAALG